MNRLGKHEKAELLERLGRWHTPNVMQDLVDETMDYLGSEHLFNQAGLAFLRDAWIAAEFADLRNADAVRLVSDNWPDFELCADGRVEAFEAVEADDPRRRRGDEYRHGIGEIEEDPIEDWISRAKQAPCWIEAACRTKLDKCYDGKVSLVIYLNMNEYGIRQAEVEACFPSATNIVSDHFTSVWILWKRRIYPIWPIAT